MMTVTTYPALYHFFGCYFHEDWFDEVTTGEENLVGGPELEPDLYKRAIRKFVSESSRRAIEAVIAELDGLLNLRLDERGLGSLLQRERIYWYNSLAPGVSQAEWLSEVKTYLQELSRA